MNLPTCAETMTHKDQHMFLILSTYLSYTKPGKEKALYPKPVPYLPQAFVLYSQKLL